MRDLYFYRPELRSGVMRIKDRKDGKEGYVVVKRSDSGKSIALSDPEYAKKHCPFLMTKSEMDKKIGEVKK